MTKPQTALSARWMSNAKLLDLMRQTIPDYSQAVRCPACGQPIGQKGDTPAKAVWKDGTKILMHGRCINVRD